jgi:hypothetical protein
MRKLLFISIFIVISGAQLDAQWERYRFGFQASPTLSWMSTDDKLINSSGTNLGIRLGTIAEYYLNENYIIKGGFHLHFNQGGQLLHDEGGDLWSEADLSMPEFTSLPDGVKLRYHLQYLEFPFSFRMRTKEMGFWRYYVEAPILQLGIRMRARGDIEGPGIPTSLEEQIREQVRFLAISYGFGAGGEYSLSEDLSLMTGLYYYRVITDITDDNGRKLDGSAEDSKGSAGSLVIHLALLF